jgi:hypothetical protein
LKKEKGLAPLFERKTEKENSPLNFKKGKGEKFQK